MNTEPNKTQQEIITGFNLGALFHGAHILERNNGYLSKKTVDKLKFAVPEFMHQYCRMTGTQSNNMALRFPGYNDPRFTDQLNNRKIPQPTTSYWYAFVDFYHKWGFKGAAITLNVNTSFDNWNLFETDVVDTLRFLEQNGVNILSLELGNELYYYPQYVAGLTRGTPHPIFDRARLGFSNANIERHILNSARVLAIHLQRVSYNLSTQGYRNIPIGVPVHSPIAMRERLFTQAILEDRSYYDFVVPHIYTSQASLQGVEAIVSRECDYLPLQLEKRVTEFNWNYQDFPKGHDLSDQRLYDFYAEAFKKRNITTYFFHCLWNQSDSNGWAKGAI